MFTKWYTTDDGCCQYMRKDGKKYEMIEYVWFDTTDEDIKNGLHEYAIVKTELNLNDITDEDILIAISSYGYTIISLIERYGDSALDIIAECIMEEEALRGCNIIDEADSEEEAEMKIKKYIEIMSYTVKLNTCGNIDYGQNPYEPMYGVPSYTFKCQTIEECVQEVRRYIELFNIGSGNWTGGQVYDENDNLIGRIHYNGRFTR